MEVYQYTLTPLHSEWPKLYGVLAVLSAIGLKNAENLILMIFYKYPVGSNRNAGVDILDLFKTSPKETV